MRGIRLVAVWLAAGAATVSIAAVATDYPVTGAVTKTDNSASFVLPPGSSFAGSSYNATTGAIGSGQFSIPAGTYSTSTAFGSIVVEYQFVQTNHSSGQVNADTSASLTTAAMELKITSLTIGGSPVPLGNCVFGPFDVDLAGFASSTMLSLADNTVTVPPATNANDCGGSVIGSYANQVIAGDYKVDMEIAGNFTPPPDNDLIFKDGFELLVP